MNPLIVLIAASTLGVEAGWEPLAEGGHEYTVQIEPSLVALLSSGSDLESVVPPQIDVRRIRIKIGSGKLARVDGAQPTRSPRLPGGTPGDGAIAAPDASTNRATPRPGEPTPAAQPPEIGAADGSTMPAGFRDDGKKAQPLVTGTGDAGGPQAHEADKPRLEAAAEAAPPWLPFLVAAVLLACSLGANFFLGWIAWDARSRYHEAVTKFRAAPSV